MNKKYLILFLIASIFMLSGCGPAVPEEQVAYTGPTVTEEQAPEVSISLIEFPSTATIGEEVTFRWNVYAPADSEFTHTAIHYSTESQPGDYGLEVAPEASGYAELTKEYASGSFEAGEFETTLTISGTTYFRAHAIVNGDNYWIAEQMISIGSAEEVTTAAVKEFEMTARQWEFTPSTIRVNEGDNVKLTINSIDVAHGFGLPDFGVNERLEPGKTVTVEFTADKKGTFAFACTVFCGTGHSGMRGTLIVE